MAQIKSLPSGTLLWRASYRVDRVLGSGGFGITYLGYDVNLGKKVAIKEYFPSRYVTRNPNTDRMEVEDAEFAPLVSEFKTKFLNEARNIARLNHPNIINIQTAFEDYGTAYYVMDYIEGGTLAQLVERRGPLPIEEALDYIRQIGKALDYIHDKHIYHLDVKPANIMLRSDGTPVLIDFGLSLPGSPSAFSPQTDIYSLAATMYFLLSDVTPPSALDLANRRMVFPPVIPVPIAAVLAKAMSPKKGDRYDAVYQFIADLEHPPRNLRVPTAPAPAQEETTQLINHPSAPFPTVPPTAPPRPVVPPGGGGSGLPPVPPADDEEESSGSSWLTTLFFTIGGVVVGLLIFFGYTWVRGYYKDKKDAETAIEDSIRNAEIDAARLETRQQDSIKRVEKEYAEFTTVILTPTDLMRKTRDGYYELRNYSDIASTLESKGYYADWGNRGMDASVKRDNPKTGNTYSCKVEISNYDDVRIYFGSASDAKSFYKKAAAYDYSEGYWTQSGSTVRFVFDTSASLRSRALDAIHSL